jgi:hypothetical protein
MLTKPPGKPSRRVLNGLNVVSARTGHDLPQDKLIEMFSRLESVASILAGDLSACEGDSVPLSDRENRALQYLRDQYAKTGNFPSSRKMARDLGYRSSRSGHTLIQALIEKGLLVRGPSKRLAFRQGFRK